ncbi:potassium transporter Trk [Streptomyces qinzhouensis]|uniref:Potassium transporter Trk n=1 Tax=Streptomyces qinzhouensis TaxID=2599401 RepID=A0A5B8IFY8_9ACTN|nr:potassium transporter Trk [Streptomyces qinzhouensis]
MSDTVLGGAVPAGPGSDTAPDRTAPAGPPRAPALIVGVGASRGTAVGELLGLVLDALRDAGLEAADVRELATVDTKAGEPGLLATARALGVPLVSYPAERLAGVAVPHPSDTALAATGTPSVAEAAALAEGGELLVPKRKSAPPGRPAGATCAVVRRAWPGRPTAADPGPGRHRPSSAAPAEAVAGRSAGTPVKAVENPSAPQESSRPAGPGSVDPASVDMMTIVTVGNTATRENAGRAVTPRGIRWQS